MVNLRYGCFFLITSKQAKLNQFYKACQMARVLFCQSFPLGSITTMCMMFNVVHVGNRHTFQ